MQRVAVCCSVLQGITVCCSVLQCVAVSRVCFAHWKAMTVSVLQCVALHCGVLQRIHKDISIHAYAHAHMYIRRKIWPAHGEGAAKDAQP